jgi:hypothetical protein
MYTFTNCTNFIFIQHGFTHLDGCFGLFCSKGEVLVAHVCNPSYSEGLWFEASPE